MTALVAAILVMVTTWTTPEGVHIYAPHFRDAPSGARHRAEELAMTFLLAEEAYGVDAYLLAALAFSESAFDADARGSMDEFSIMQLHPGSRWGRAAYLLCEGEQPRCERTAVLEAARLLALGQRQCGSEARALGFYKAGRCIHGPAAARVLSARDRMRSNAAGQTAPGGTR